MVDLIEEIKNLNHILLKSLFQNKKNNRPKPLQVLIIDYLYKNKINVVTQKDLELHFKISKAAISDVLKAMEKSNMITRTTSKKDARINEVKLTDKALKLHHDIIENKNKFNEELISVLTKEELTSFINISNKLKEYLEGSNND